MRHAVLPMSRLDGALNGTYVESKADMAGQPEHICQLAEAGRGWPRLEAALSLSWRWRGVSKLEGEWAEASSRVA